MSASNFRASLSLVLAHEGGFVDHPKDPGGPTNNGVTQRVYDAYRSYHGLKQQSVKYILESEISDIYNKNYWRLVRGDSLPCGIDYAVFDFGVNSGVSRAIKYLQMTIGGLEVDGILGIITLAAVEAKTRLDEEAFILQYCANRVAFLRSLSTFPTFGKGWLRRVVGYQLGVQLDDTGVADYATKMAKRDMTYVMPSEIGSLAGETNGKSVAPDKPESYVVAPPVKTLRELRESLALENDKIASIIAVG